MTGRLTQRRPAGPVRSVRARLRTVAAAATLLALAVPVAGCTRAGSGPAPGSTVASSTPSPPSTVTSIVGTSTVTSTRTTVTGTVTIRGTVTTVTASSPAAGPPPATAEPKPVPGACPYLSDEDVMQANGQHTGQTSVIDVAPYPVCVFTRADGGYLATTRIVIAKTAAQAVAAVNQHVPPAKSSPASSPAGWSGGAMGDLKGVPGYPLAESVYAVSKGTVAVIAISNQAQSIKGRQMAEQIIANLHL